MRVPLPVILMGAMVLGFLTATFLHTPPLHSHVEEEDVLEELVFFFLAFAPLLLLLSRGALPACARRLSSTAELPDVPRLLAWQAMRSALARDDIICLCFEGVFSGLTVTLFRYTFSRKMNSPSPSSMPTAFVLPESLCCSTRDQTLKQYPFMMCAVCGESAPFRCVACSVVCYCSPACQRADWTMHREKCSYLRNAKRMRDGGSLFHDYRNKRTASYLSNVLNTEVN